MSGSLIFNDQLLQNFMQRFYGYGTYAGDYWFVGMEEGGGNLLVEKPNTRFLRSPPIPATEESGTNTFIKLAK